MAMRFGLMGALLAATAIAVPARAAWVQWSVAVGGNGHWYRLVEDTKSGWTAARTAAQTVWGGDLVTITSAAEQTFINTALFGGATGTTVNTPALIGSWWIGATDAATEGTWTWVTGESWSFTNWGSGQPDNNASFPFGDAGGEDYAQLVWRNAWSSALPGGWNDAREAGYSGIANLPHLDRKGFIVERTTDPFAVPAPAGLGLFGLALLALAIARRRA